MDSWHDDEDNLFGDGSDSQGDQWKSSGKHALIFLIDCSPSMHMKREKNDHTDDSVDTPFKKALRCVHSTLRTKIFASPDDVIGVLLFGTKDKVGVRDFDGLSLLLNIAKPEGDAILKLEELLEETDQFVLKEFGGPSDTSYAIHEALWQCQGTYLVVIM